MYTTLYLSLNNIILEPGSFAYIYLFHCLTRIPLLSFAITNFLPSFPNPSNIYLTSRNFSILQIFLLFIYNEWIIWSLLTKTLPTSANVPYSSNAFCCQSNLRWILTPPVRVKSVTLCEFSYSVLLCLQAISDTKLTKDTFL